MFRDEVSEGVRCKAGSHSCNLRLPACNGCPDDDRIVEDCQILSWHAKCSMECFTWKQRGEVEAWTPAPFVNISDEIVEGIDQLCILRLSIMFKI